MDLAIRFPAQGRIHLESRFLFADPGERNCRQFVERVISRDLDHNVWRSWRLILAPNIACIAGVFTMGFGIMASVVTNNVAALAALGNGHAPLAKDRSD